VNTVRICTIYNRRNAHHQTGRLGCVFLGLTVGWGVWEEGSRRFRQKRRDSDSIGKSFR